MPEGKVVVSIRYDKPEVADGPKIWSLVRDSGVLDVNSPYTYLLFAKRFSDTCITAKAGEDLVGFIVGFRPPDKPDTLFVWQIGVDRAYRGQGLARRMLTELAARKAPHGVRYLEATVTPSNEASQRTFRAFARGVGATCDETLEFPAHLFPGTHEEERLLRIGPFTADAVRNAQHETVAAANS